MDRCVCFGFVALVLSLTAGCGQGPSGGSSAATNGTNQGADPNVLAHPAAQVANDFLSAVVNGNQQQIIQYYTPRAAEQMQQLPLRENEFSYQLRGAKNVNGELVLVESQITMTAVEGQPEEESTCIVLESVGGQWRVSGWVFEGGSQSATPVIISFEQPNRGPIPFNQWLSEKQSLVSQPRPSPPRTAQDQEVIPAGAYR